MKPKDVTQELFDDMLFKVIDEENASSLLAIPGVYELVSEEYNNEVLRRLEEINIIDMPMRPGTTKADRVRQLGLNDFTFDYAIPHDWLERAVACLKSKYPGQYGDGDDKLNPYQAILGGTVWLYDKHGRIFGRPYPITRTAKDALERLYDKLGYDDREPEKPE
jgi:hypothetical protein